MVVSSHVPRVNFGPTVCKILALKVVTHTESQGRDALLGSPFRCDNALHATNPPKPGEVPKRIEIEGPRHLSTIPKPRQQRARFEIQ